jgi:hypothetical protein
VKTPHWTDEIPTPATWAADLTPFADWTEDIEQLLDEAQSESPEIDTTLRLPDDRQLITHPTRRLFVDYRSNPDAYRHLDPLPQEGETLHGVISGKYALYELIPALLERTGQKIKSLYIATLSFNKQNAADILALYDHGHVQKISLLISYYYKSTSREIYDLLVPPLRDRGQRVLAIRNHAKLLMAEMDDGTRYTTESSANLRSSVNIEQFAMTRGADLYDFHQGWIEDLFQTKKDLGGK